MVENAPRHHDAKAQGPGSLSSGSWGRTAWEYPCTRANFYRGNILEAGRRVASSFFMKNYPSTSSSCGFSPSVILYTRLQRISEPHTESNSVQNRITEHKMDSGGDRTTF